MAVAEDFASQCPVHAENDSKMKHNRSYLVHKHLRKHSNTTKMVSHASLINNKQEEELS